MAQCQIEGCEKPVRCRGWCDQHYTRWRRHGDPETVLVEHGRPELERLWQYVDKQPNGCWLWTGYLDGKGYGFLRLTRSRKTVRAHRLAYEALVGPIPEGMELDHLCRIIRCVNPDHLEPVTHAENVRRGRGGEHNRLKTHCAQGHEFTPENTYIRSNGGRFCRTCGRANTKRWRDRKTAEASQQPLPVHPVR